MADATTLNPALAGGDTTIATFARLIAGMSRFLSQLSRSAPFADATIGLGEWCALAVLEKSDGISNSVLARTLGVTNQRAAQISEVLSKAKLITVVPSAEDSRKNVISISPAGRSVLTSLNAQIEPMVATALGKSVKTLTVMERVVNRRLMGMVKRRPAAATK